jgi:hypothetical protein
MIFKDEKRSHIAVSNWIQRFGSSQIYKRKRAAEHSLLTKLLFRLAVNISGYGFV